MNLTSVAKIVLVSFICQLCFSEIINLIKRFICEHLKFREVYVVYIRSLEKKIHFYFNKIAVREYKLLY